MRNIITDAGSSVGCFFLLFFAKDRRRPVWTDNKPTRIGRRQLDKRVERVTAEKRGRRERERVGCVLSNELLELRGRAATNLLLGEIRPSAQRWRMKRSKCIQDVGRRTQVTKSCDRDECQSTHVRLLPSTPQPIWQRKKKNISLSTWQTFFFQDVGRLLLLPTTSIPKTNSLPF
jgi:hypothetical protein